MAFSFRGEISSSKSLFNRALIAQSFSNAVQIHGLTQSEDVLHLQKSLKAFRQGEKDFFCGDGGTTLRFLAVRVSREPGEYKLRGSAQLFSRPIKPLLHFFNQVGVKYKCDELSLTITSSGWSLPSKVFCSSTESSQFASAILLSAWGLQQDLHVSLPRNLPSIGYLQMTLKLMEFFGAHCKVRHATSFDDPSLVFKAGQMPKSEILNIEQDMSSLFALAACAIMGGEIEITRVPEESWQPDAVFFDFFRKMKINYILDNKTFFIRQQEVYRGLDVDLLNCPDLFPVLAVLSCRSQGVSTFLGLENLQFKESDRFQNTIDLIRRLGRRVDVVSRGIMIHGLSKPFEAKGDFDPHKDHRMAMAARVANFGGAQFRILDKTVVNKSFPEFWTILGEDAE